MKLKTVRKKNKELTRLRKKSGLTQMDIWVLTKGLISASKMSHFEQGYLFPSEDEVDALATAFQVPKEELGDILKD